MIATSAEQVARPLLVHAGVAYGEVIASGPGSTAHLEYTVRGDAVNLAARLQDNSGRRRDDGVRRALSRGQTRRVVEAGGESR